MSVCGLHGRATVIPGDPFNFCDRCNFEYNLSDLTWQWQWGGNQLINLQILVCDRCLDLPSEFLKAIVLPPDPAPILNIRPGHWASEEAEGQSAIPA